MLKNLTPYYKAGAAKIQFYGQKVYNALILWRAEVTIFTPVAYNTDSTVNILQALGQTGKKAIEPVRAK
ncbi:MAG: hypothetical protein PHG73_08865 [Pygmaiobacter sp.]|nr:hypothetical protein [Pygmaiobacter sp.]